MKSYGKHSSSSTWNYNFIRSPKEKSSCHFHWVRNIKTQTKILPTKHTLLCLLHNFLQYAILFQLNSTWIKNSKTKYEIRFSLVSKSRYILSVSSGKHRKILVNVKCEYWIQLLVCHFIDFFLLSFNFSNATSYTANMLCYFTVPYIQYNLAYQC